MRILILGLGNIGRSLAERQRGQGHSVVGTTTTPGKVDDLKKHVDDVAVLFGHETEKVKAAAAGCDAIVVTVAPNVQQSRTVEEREHHYRQVLVDSCVNAAAAAPRVVFASSFSVYGDGGDGDSPISEETPCANHDEPSSKYYQQAEQAVLSIDGGCVLRFPDMYGAPGDMSYPDRVRLCHQYMGGKAIFGADAPLYCIHYLDVVSAIEHALTHELSGIYNVCDNDNLPYTNQQVFDAICDAEGLARLEFLNHIQAPNRKISAHKLYATGFRVQHPDPNRTVVEKGNRP
ncbi:MAG: NAD-dependent epimerase/dehydratase family protein [Gammaproteobacteria bacterium]|nr:NAD-dependent epimerase/dehydratase family protein [Gammaproteobacteria bacterium]